MCPLFSLYLSYLEQNLCDVFECNLRLVFDFVYIVRCVPLRSYLFQYLQYLSIQNVGDNLCCFNYITNVPLNENNMFVYVCMYYVVYIYI